MVVNTSNAMTCSPCASARGSSTDGVGGNATAFVSVFLSNLSAQRNEWALLNKQKRGFGIGFKVKKNVQKLKKSSALHLSLWLSSSVGGSDELERHG